MSRRAVLAVFIGLCFLSSLVVLTFISPASAEPITLKFAHQNPPKGRTTIKVLDAFSKRIEEVSGGKVKIVSYPAQTLLKANEVVTGVESGIADMSWTPLGYFSGRFPLTTVAMLPFIALKDAESNSALLQELYDTLPEIQKEYRSMKVLSFHASDAHQLFTSRKPATKQADLTGLKLRIMGKYPIQAAKLLGMAPLFMAMPGIYEAGEKGVLDGAVLSWASVATFKLYEVFPFHTVVDLWSAPFMLFMNKDKWNSLPDDVKKAIDGIGGVKLAKWAGKAGFGPDVMDEVLKRAEKENKKVQSVSLEPGELEKWKKIAGEPVWEAWVKEMDKKGLPGRKVLDTALKLVEKYR